MKILITGGTGFIGSALVRRLVAEGRDEVYVLDKDISNIFRLESVKDKINLSEGDILNPKSYVDQIINIKPDVVYHLAWYAEPGKYLISIENLEHLKYGIDFIKFLFELGVKKIIVTGTCFEYDTNYGYLSESTPEKPEHLYSSCKLALKKVAEQLSYIYEIPFVWARIFYLYGPYEHPNRLVPYVINSLLNNKRVELRSHGLQIRDYLHVDDVAQGLICLLKEEKTSTYNIGSGNPVRIRDLVNQIGEILKKKELINFAPDTTLLNEPMFICADNTKLKKLGFKIEKDMKNYLEQIKGGDCNDN
ncbi:MAG: NAD(P)-dependent oxidoreductase [Candidatus Huberarchaeum crystalense]|uniref:NAD(P)-dependent oxidoreductase n=2 Tax=Huberarchaeum crystalense TaxID=2014257 RepID=A0A2H9P8F5_HUBC1|nr:MAG: NAD(P)-dependent oxidoreductase [Candidatus Huberarchaeum crystalense]